MIDEKKSEEAAIVRDINFDFIRVPVLVLSSSFLALDIDSMFRLGNLKRNDFENGSSGKLQTIQVKNFETVDFKRFKLGTSK
ncbi:unnamed protein product [Rhizophagus irregularis]|nr:unnamed protein product [Rhizophagus irregularis]CAB5302830.1 unnamed protein product [Rhizophagus irregularis]